MHQIETPEVLHTTTYSMNNRYRINLIAGFILLLGLTVTFLIWRITQENVTKNEQSQFQVVVNQIEYALTRRIQTYTDILFALQGLFVASVSVDRPEWNPFVTTAKIADYSDIAYVSYLEVVEESEKQVFVENFRNDTSTNLVGYPNLDIYPDGVREEYAVVKYINPENEETLSALGFDLFSSPPRKVALERARDTNAPAASETIPFATEGSLGFFIAAPIYQNDLPSNTITERRAALKGFVNLAIRNDDLFADAFPPSSHPDISFTVYDGEYVLYTSQVSAERRSDLERGTHMQTRTLEIGGRTWQLMVTSLPTFGNAQSQRVLPLVIGGSGVAFSFLVTAIFYLTMRRAGKLINLQGKALESAANGVVITNHQGTIEWVNPAFTKLTGYAPREVIGQNPRILNSGKQDENFYHSLWDTIRSGKIWHGEITNRKKDGTLYEEEQIITPVEDDLGKISHFIAIKQDVTVRKQAEEELKQAKEKLDNKVGELERMNKLMVGRELKMRELKQEINQLKSP